MTEIQATLLDLYPCPSCNGKGTKHDHETNDERVCVTCQGTKNVPWDPEDKSIPY